MTARKLRPHKKLFARPVVHHPGHSKTQFSEAVAMLPLSFLRAARFVYKLARLDKN